MHTKKDGLLFPPVEVELLHEKGSFVFRFLVSFVGRCLREVFIYEFLILDMGILLLLLLLMGE